MSKTNTQPNQINMSCISGSVEREMKTVKQYFEQYVKLFARNEFITKKC